jgi:L-malate glycosyltransferase
MLCELDSAIWGQAVLEGQFYLRVCRLRFQSALGRSLDDKLPLDTGSSTVTDRHELPRMSTAARIRVLLIAPSMAIVGGQSIQADRLLNAFARDSQIEMRLRPIDPKLPSFIRNLPYIRTVANAPLYYAGLLKDIAQSDIVHAFTSSFWGYTLWIIPAVLLSRGLRRKIVVNYHDGRAEHHLRDWRSAVSTLERADAIVVPSPYLVDVFRKYGLSAEAIWNTIDLPMFRYRERSSVRPVFLTNRGMEELYNVDCTLHCFKLVQDRYPAARFVVANDGPLRRELEALSRELGLKDLTFTGAVSQTHMAKLYDDADIYVMSPRIDNMPLTILECFASGVSVVSTQAGGVPYIAEHERNALLAPCGSAEALANACFRLLEEPGLALRLAREGYKDCVERYSVPAVREQWRGFYHRLLGIQGTRA